MNRYPALKIIAILNYVLGCLFVLAAIFIAIKISNFDGSIAFGAFGAFAFGLFLALGCFAIAELIGVFTDIEKNTRTRVATQSEEAEVMASAKTAGIEISADGQWKCPSCWHLNSLPLGKCGYCPHDATPT